MDLRIVWGGDTPDIVLKAPTHFTSENLESVRIVVSGGQAARLYKLTDVEAVPAAPISPPVNPLSPLVYPPGVRHAIGPQMLGAVGAEVPRGAAGRTYPKDT